MADLQGTPGVVERRTTAALGVVVVKLPEVPAGHSVRVLTDESLVVVSRETFIAEWHAFFGEDTGDVGARFLDSVAGTMDLTQTVPLRHLGEPTLCWFPRHLCWIPQYVAGRKRRSHAGRRFWAWITARVPLCATRRLKGRASRESWLLGGNSSGPPRGAR